MSPKTKRKKPARTARKVRRDHMRIEVGPASAKTRRVSPWATWQTTCRFNGQLAAFNVKRDALIRARTWAVAIWKDGAGRPSSIRIKDRHGVYRGESTYPRSTDPNPPKG